MPNIGVVKDASDNSSTDVGESLLDSLQHGPREAAVLHHHKCQIHRACDYGSITDTKDRGRVKEDHVVVTPHILDQVDHSLGVQDSRRIDRQTTTWQESEVLDLCCH